MDDGAINNHLYSSSGEYNVTLTVTDNDGLTHKMMKKVEVLIPSTIDINPDTLNTKSNGKWITSYIELPTGFDVSDIDISTILLNNKVLAEKHPTNIGDYNNDDIPDLMVKFNRQDVQDILEQGNNVEIIVSGELSNVVKFEGSDHIRVK